MLSARVDASWHHRLCTYLETGRKGRLRVVVCAGENVAQQHAIEAGCPLTTRRAERDGKVFPCFKGVQARRELSSARRDRLPHPATGSR